MISVQLYISHQLDLSQLDNFMSILILCSSGLIIYKNLIAWM